MMARFWAAQFENHRMQGIAFCQKNALSLSHLSSSMVGFLAATPAPERRVAGAESSKGWSGASSFGHADPAPLSSSLRFLLFPILAAAPDPEQIRTALAEVLSKPEFSAQSEEPFFRLLELFRWLGTLYASSPALFWFLLLTCLGLLVAIAVHITFTVRGVFAARDRQQNTAQGAAERQRLSESYRRQAGVAAEHQDYTEAIRFLFLSLVYRFDETGKAGFHREQTNHEYLSLFEHRPPLRDSLRVFVDILDNYWYGQRPAEPERYTECQALYQQIAGA
jgi:hypothetical protein